MEFTSSNDRDRLKATFEQINTAINQLKEWNADVKSAEDYYLSPGGMKTLAANCMLIEAIGEGIKQIDKLTNGQLLPERPEIPWIDVMGIRNHIAHGYFDINGYLIFSTIKNDLDSLQKAIEYFLETI
ncbi:DUF86 domain-containing protein [Xylanibacter ruminicola]|jgi:uncharacterized protein with HEPN domain|uniref:Uncharacterized conserved protein, contains HEPN domain n=1 Tax=Xylanibacter ruminicola TaxID=839 RepID=A0A1M6Z9E5_XYLRU|nr:HepT-like ribonuclease domain-containing protein [Xylanibacter ruminicola]SHL27136.1 Uncharacterized conserved protein, contains HEPN domain [Xylanibacter ruminicola]